jgi:transposase
LKTIRLALRQEILRNYNRGNHTRQEIADKHGVSLGMVKKLLSQRKNTGQIADRHKFSGRKQVLITRAMRRKLGLFKNRHPEAKLRELRTLLRVECSLSAIHYALRKMWMNKKRIRLSRSRYYP